MELLAAIEFGAGALAAAFAAGVVSFISPCVLPLVPGYLSIVSGVGVGELGAQPRRVASSTVAFVLGFGTVFVLLGAGAAWFGDVLLSNRRTLEIVAGVFIVFAGLVYAGAPLPLDIARSSEPLPGHCSWCSASCSRAATWLVSRGRSRSSRASRSRQGRKDSRSLRRRSRRPSTGCRAGPVL